VLRLPCTFAVATFGGCNWTIFSEIGNGSTYKMNPAITRHGGSRRR